MLKLGLVDLFRLSFPVRGYPNLTLPIYLLIVVNMLPTREIISPSYQYVISISHIQTFKQIFFFIHFLLKGI